MPLDLNPIHTTTKSLSVDMIFILDRYKNKEVKIDELRHWLETWERNCPNLLFKDEAHTVLMRSLQNYLGKRRRLLVETILIHRKDI